MWVNGNCVYISIAFNFFNTQFPLTHIRLDAFTYIVSVYVYYIPFYVKCRFHTLGLCLILFQS